MELDRYRVKGELRLEDWDAGASGDLDKAEAKERTKTLLLEMRGWQERLYAEGRQSLLIVLQGRDAGGKDGTVKHVFRGVNPQGVSVVSFKVPTEEERARDFLWRVHREVPRAGRIGVFNRSQYEDVLVPRAHGQIDAEEAERRAVHIRNFEALLHDSGTRVVKFYLHITPEEQLERLEARLEDPTKLWKFDPGDLEERALWNAYTQAYEDVLVATSTENAPWYVIPANRKWFRNLLVAEIVVSTLASMKPEYPTRPGS